MNRIQRLLLNEYSDFEDVVLIESPFVEVTRCGTGLRQLQIGLTNTKLIIAADILRKMKYSYKYFPGRPEVDLENFELISIFPIGVVSLSVFQKRRRQVLKARIHSGSPEYNLKILYYELGGPDRLKMWKLWCERVGILSPNNRGGSSTEPSVGSSTSNGSLFINKSGMIWQEYPQSNSSIITETTTLERLRNISERSVDNARNLSKDKTDVRILYRNRAAISTSSSSGNSLGNLQTSAGCIHQYMHLITNQSNISVKPTSLSKITETSIKNYISYLELIARIWEKNCLKPLKGKRVRGYDVYPNPGFFNGLGLINVNNTMVHMMQRSQSAIHIINEFFQEPILSDKSKSYNCLDDRSRTSQKDPGDEILYFWTTDYWYKPDKVNLKLKRTMDDNKQLSKWKKLIFKKRKISNEKNIQKIVSVLELKNDITLSHLTSSAVACELTIIDVNLFLKIPKQELHIVKKQGTIRNCKNLITWLAFSYRLTCLMATEILSSATERTRSRLIARIINTCEKTHTLKNYNGTKNLLAALQSLAVYRLRETWSYVRKYHATCYNTFKALSREYFSDKRKIFTTAPYLITSEYFMSAIAKEISVKNTNQRKKKNKKKSHTQNIEDILIVSQSAARRFNLSGCSVAREFLLRKNYCEPLANFRESFVIEPSRFYENNGIT